MKPILIGISGKIGAGKSRSVAELLRILSEMGHDDVREMSFAEALKNNAATIMNEPRHLFDDREGKEKWSNIWNCTFGQFLQKFGEWARQIGGDDIWIRKLFSQYDAATCNWIISDVRYPNEADEIKKRGGVVIRISRDYHLRKSIIGKRYHDHPSETALDNYGKFDNVIMNNRSEEQLVMILREMIRSYLKK